ncbi:CBO0543 family protein [Paenibacillus koleovorans]|uniref:CBO0543 family protein n=1 Tax=Paenibacillus koleovorans TaxID=121608 RepID=UPI000FD6BAA4|nr:CBO0543 family protein [Paenibacillus koleovorans]
MKDHIISSSCILLSALLVLVFTPRDRIRDANVVFLFKQVITWLFGLMVVQFRLIEYPIREFPYATKASFAFEYFIFPSMCVIFVLRFPERKSRLHKLGWYLFWPTWLTIVEQIIRLHTNLVQYLHWNWFLTWITLLASFFISHLYYKWFVRKGVPSRSL